MRIAFKLLNVLNILRHSCSISVCTSTDRILFRCSRVPEWDGAVENFFTVPLDNTLMVVTGDSLLTAPVLELVLRLAPDAEFDPESLLTAAICPEISEKTIEKSDK